MKSKDQILLEQAYQKVLKEQATKVVAHGFSDKGVSSYRYTMLEPHIKLNKKAGHGMFDEDYITTVYDSLDKAYKELVDSLKDDKLNLRNFKKNFMEELARNGTVVVYSYHVGNHFQEPATTMLVREEGNWDQVPLEIDEDNVIKEYNTTEEEYSLRTDIPYSEIVPSRKESGNFFNTEKYNVIHDLPMSKALETITDHYEKSFAHQVDSCKKGEYTVGQMKEVKDVEDFAQLLKQGKFAECYVERLKSYLYNCLKWFPQYKEEILDLQKHVEKRKLNQKINKELHKDWNVDLSGF
jgi:hypothetical protein